jgi:hypothetical protein
MREARAAFSFCLLFSLPVPQTLAGAAQKKKEGADNGISLNAILS